MTSDELKELNARFEKAPPQEILAWAIGTYGDSAALSSSFGGQSAALIHMAVQIKPDLPILFIDTGFLFKETHRFKDDLRKRLQLNVREFRATPEEIEQTRRNLERRNTRDAPCCDESKIACMKRSLAGVQCWIAGLRRSQGNARKEIAIIERYDEGLVKVHPFANWTEKDVYSYMKAHALPFHPLWEKGFTSIGCEPCTSVPSEGNGERSGRWAGTAKTECGIHTFLQKKD